MPSRRQSRFSTRRTARFAFPRKQRRTAPRTPADPRQQQDGSDRPLQWPANTIPVELFNEIISYLPRSDVESLRVVNREFEFKLASQYFRNVVVPFRAELYTAQTDAERQVEDQPTVTANTLSHAGSILSNGMRIFESFGHHIVRFALSLELSEDHLAYPPIKTTQNAIPTYWGIYRWPIDSYARYAEIETLEDTADETLRLREALTSLTQVKDLGLSCDAGLGYLCGPDRDTRTLPAPHPVFGLRNVPYGSLQRPERTSRRTALLHPRDTKMSVLKSMVRRAGYTEAQTQDAIETLLSTEGATLSGLEFDERGAPAPAPAPATPPPAEPTTPDAWAGTMNSPGAQRAIALQQRWGNHPSHYPLHPKTLTRGQREMVLEMDWAHRALIQSYVIAILDNSLANRFTSLTSLTIAKIPSSHIEMLQRHDLWNTLTGLKNLTLAVIPDWRTVSKPSPGYLVQEWRVSPVDAVGKVFELLSEYVALQRNITFFHFEWICGGEFAPGVYQRNSYVLPAPFCAPTAVFEPHTAIAGPLLQMPHVQHLSLKNCYSTPHVFNQVIRTMTLKSLSRLELESVSLTGHMRKRPRLAGITPSGERVFESIVVFGTVAVAAADNNGTVPFQGDPQDQPVADDDHSDSDSELDAGAAPAEPRGGLRPPSQMSWPGFINHFTPGATFEDMTRRQPGDSPLRAEGPQIRRWLPHGRAFAEERERGDYKLQSISFKSCGYVRLVPINTIGSVVNDVPWGDSDIAARIKELDGFMQVCNDHGLAKIINKLPPEDDLHFATTWGMRQGWTNLYDASTIRDAQLDGILEPGRGRFSGVVKGPKPPPGEGP